MAFNHPIHCLYKGIRGFVSVYRQGLRYRDMITKIALHKAKILTFWDKHGLVATLDAFEVKRRTLFLWKRKLKEGEGNLESLNNLSKTPKTKRKRNWSSEVVEEIKRLRWFHPNLGKEKLYSELKTFCDSKGLICPKPKTIGRIIKDLGGLRIFPQRISHFGKIKPIKRQKVVRKPKDFKAMYPGHCVALDTIEKIIDGKRRYLITFEDLFTRFGFAWETTSHASLAAKEFFNICQKIFPFAFIFVLTDNGSEFKKHFSEKVKRLHLTHYHTYPRTPKMNAHCERFNRTIQDEFVDYHLNEMIEPDIFNQKLTDYLIWYNTRRVHYAFKNKKSPLQFMLSLPINQIPEKCKSGWPHTKKLLFIINKVK